MAVGLQFIPVKKPITAQTDSPSLDSLIDNIRATARKRQEITLCDSVLHNHVIGCAGSSFSSKYLSEPILYQYARDLFKNLQTAAEEGKTSIKFTLLLEGEEDAITKAVNFCHVARTFERMVVLRSNTQPANATDHSVFCQLLSSSPELYFSWAANNPYLNPKPLLQLTPTSSWGVNRLNEERRSGEGTDLVLDLGNAGKFPVHRMMVKSFCPYFEKLLNRPWKESQSEEVTLENTAGLSREAAEAAISYMYTRKIDFKALGSLTAIHLLEWSLFIFSEGLQAEAFNHLSKNGEKLADNEILHLLFLNANHSLPELNTLCLWFLKSRPRFSDSLVGQEELEAEKLLMLFTIAAHYKIEKLRPEFERHWHDLSLENKTAQVIMAMAKGNISLIKELDKFCKRALKHIQSDEPGSKEFIKAYQQIHTRTFEIRTRAIAS